MKIISKKQAISKILDTLFVPGGTARREKYDNGKYKWTKEKDLIGRVVQDLPGVIAVYVEKRKDKNGYYAQVMCCKIN